MNSKEESAFDAVDLDLFFCPAPQGTASPELTEEQLQEIEARVERFYLALAGAL